MPDPVDSLDAPIDWRDPALWPILSDLQGNILKGHGRDHTLNIFLRFDASRVADVRKAIRSLAANVTSALTQLRETSVFRIVGRPGGTAVYLAISAAGYRAIGLTPPGNPAFLGGMAARGTDLGDPDEMDWEDHLRGVHALLIVADDSDTLVAEAATLLTAGLGSAGITVLGLDAGHARCRAPAAGSGKAIKHFGYVDRRSQPLLLAEDVAAERAKKGSFLWDPGFSPRHCALVRDPHGAFGDSFGSYLVYRKLEQNVAGFRARETALADSLGPVGQEQKCGGAAMANHSGAGRSGDSPLLTLAEAAAAGASTHVDHAVDAAGLRCPFMSHVRQANSHGDTERMLGASFDSERAHLMPRRGIHYGKPADRDPDGSSSGVGLLFMAYNADIGRQFEFTQKFWVNNPAFVDDALAGAPNMGIDPIIGHAVPAMAVEPQSWQASHDGRGGSARFAFTDFVTMKGGEYLFAPSLSALAAL